MKFKRFIALLGLVALMMGSVSVRADESKLSQWQTALSSTTISGYVDVAAQFSANISGNPVWFGLFFFLGLFHRAG